MNYLEYKVWFCSQREYHKFAIIDYHTTITDTYEIYLNKLPSSPIEVVDSHPLSTSYTIAMSASAIACTSIEYTPIDLNAAEFLDASLLILYPTGFDKPTEISTKYNLNSNVGVLLKTEIYLNSPIYTYYFLEGTSLPPIPTYIYSTSNIVSKYSFTLGDCDSISASSNSHTNILTRYNLKPVIINKSMSNTLEDLSDFSLEHLGESSTTLLIVTHLYKN